MIAAPEVRVIEEVRVFTPLGIRFWDPVGDEQVRAGLQVRAWPRPVPGRPPGATDLARRAYRTASDVYAFQGLPGLRAVELPAPGDGGSPGESSPPAPRPFVVEARDPRGRFLDVALEVELPLPYRGVFLAGAATSPLEPSPPGLHLYSAPTRPPSPGIAWVRAELVERATGRPAAWALATLAAPGGRHWHGISDAAGRLALAFPYPDLPDGFGGSPSSPGARPLAERTWPVTLSIAYAPEERRALPGTPVPDYLSILAQSPARVWPGNPEDDAAGFDELDAELEFGRDLTLRTEGRPALLVTPGVSSP